MTFVLTVGSPFSVSSGGGVLGPGQSMPLTISVDRSPPAAEGPLSATATLVPVEAGVASASMNLLAIVERPPVVVVDGPPSAGYCPRVSTIGVSVRAAVTDALRHQPKYLDIGQRPDPTRYSAHQLPPWGGEYPEHESPRTPTRTKLRIAAQSPSIIIRKGSATVAGRSSDPPDRHSRHASRPTIKGGPLDPPTRLSPCRASRCA